MERLRADLVRRFSSPIPYIICCCLTVIVALIGPFGTYDAASLPVLVVYWGAIVFWSALASIAISSMVRVYLGSPGIRATVITSVLFTASFVPLLTWFTGLFFASMPPMGHLAIQVFFITAAISVLVYQIQKYLTPSATEQPRIWRRLPEAEHGDIIRLSSEGHYVWIHATSGVYRLRLRFADAVSETDGVVGACVHRSHWVARDHVVRTTEKNNRPLLIMSDGAEIPVSRTYRHEAERLELLSEERGLQLRQTSSAQQGQFVRRAAQQNRVRFFIK